jgi:hypothetical protein
MAKLSTNKDASEWMMCGQNLLTLSNLNKIGANI